MNRIESVHSVTNSSRGRHAITALMLGGVVVLCFGLRLYNNFATTGTLQIVSKIVERFPDQPKIYTVASMIADLPSILSSCVLISFVMSTFIRQGLWKYALATTAVSELIWIFLWGVHISGLGWSELTRSVLIIRSISYIVGISLAGFFMEAVFSGWRMQAKRENAC